MRQERLRRREKMGGIGTLKEEAGSWKPPFISSRDEGGGPRSTRGQATGSQGAPPCALRSSGAQAGSGPGGWQDMHRAWAQAHRTERQAQAPLRPFSLRLGFLTLKRQ